MGPKFDRADDSQSRKAAKRERQVRVRQNLPIRIYLVMSLMRAPWQAGSPTAFQIEEVSCIS